MPDLTRIQTLFAWLILIQFAVVVLHDWLEIPGLTRSSQVRAVVGTRKLLIATLINALFPGAAAALVLWYWNQTPSPVATGYWLAYTAITVLSAIAMWYLPYLFGAKASTRQDYLAMYRRTFRVLPRRGANPRPNLLHVLFHLLFVGTFALALVLWLKTR